MVPTEDSTARGLPKDWRRGHLPDSRMHFIHATGKTSLINPWAEYYESAQHEADLGPLPKGWEIRWSPAGRPFFRHEGSQRCQLSDPRCLPEGWEFRTDGEGAKSWYVDHNTKMTSWDHPDESKKTVETIGHLPDGWIVKLADDGREYYVDPKDKKTSWVCPFTAGVVALTDMIRPEEWEIQFTSSREMYFVHCETRIAHWTFPGERERVAGVTGPLPDGCELRLSPSWRYYLVDHKTRSNRWIENPAGSHDIPVLDPDDGFGPLPSGWIKRQTLDGMVVFVDQNTKTTIWFDPRYMPQLPDYNDKKIPNPVGSIEPRIEIGAEHTPQESIKGEQQTANAGARETERPTLTEKKEDTLHVKSQANNKLKTPPDNGLFRHRSLGKDEIRILLIRPASNLEAPLLCTLEEVSLSAMPKYDALSYTWGDRKNMTVISVDGQEFTIRENALAALRRLRLPRTPRAIWIDAICINQNDMSEKSSQLPLMTKIYQQAQQVCIWLGDETEGSIIGMSKLQGRKKNTALATQIRDVEKKHGDLLLPLRARFRGGGAWQDSANRTFEFETGEVRELLCRPWWSRVWIMQEVILGRKPVILCGGEVVEWEALGKWQEITQQKTKSGTRLNTEPFGLGSVQERDIFDGFYQTLSNFRHLWETRKWGVSTYDLLYQFRHLGCTDSKDRIFGFLGLTPLSLDPKFKPDYNLTLNAIYRNFARSAIEHFHSLDILNYKREWRNVPPVAPVVYAYSMIDQAKYHDIHASIIDSEGKKPRVGWARLPPGWERRKNEKTSEYEFFDWEIRKPHSSSLLTGSEPSQAQHIGEQKICPPGWRKTWDNLGRVKIFYDPEYLQEQDGTQLSELSRLPSWVPNWACGTHRDPSPLLDWKDTNRMFSAGGKDPVSPNLGNDPNVLDLQGGLFDEIYQISQPWHPTSDSPPMSRKRIDVLETWEALGLAELTPCPYGGGEDRKNALWRTYIADLPGEHASPKRDRWLIECWCDRVGWAREKPSLKDLAGKGILKTAMASQTYQSKTEMDMHNHLLKIIEADWNRRFNAGEIPEAELSTKEIKKYWAVETKDAIERYGVIAKKIFEVCRHRVLFVTARGYLGLAPWNAKVGDKVFVLKGGKTPFLLRGVDRQLDAYELVGETFVYGIMGGEGLELCEAGLTDVKLI